MLSRWIWPFELEEKIGEGGMGVVYRGRYVKNDKLYAVKLVPADVTDKTLLARFEREMDVLKNLRHPGIVRSFGGVCEDKQRFYAMELVEGGTLKTLLDERGPLPWQEVVEYGLQICDALSYAHQKGIVHRDIKPGNFLIAEDGQLKLSDFGLISIRAGASLTAEGKTLGTFRYMAPEQIRGKPEPSGQTDLYALGCVLFELLTGETPFLGMTPAETLHKHLQESPPCVTETVPDCPALLVELVASLLEKKIDKRPATASDVKRILSEVAQNVIVETGRKKAIRQEAPVRKSAFKVASPAQWLPAGSAGWVLALSLLGIVVLLIWNLSLSQTNKQLARAEDLWIVASQHHRPEIRIAAVHALGELSVSSEVALETLLGGLSSEQDSRVRKEIVIVLGEAGVAAREAHSELLTLQKTDENEQVRIQAGLAIEKIRNAKEPESSWWSYVAVFLVLGVVVFVWKWFF